MSALICGKVNACRFPAETGGRASRGPIAQSQFERSRRGGRVPPGTRQLQPIDEFAVDLLQIAQKENFEAFIDCAIAVRAMPAQGMKRVMGHRG